MNQIVSQANYSILHLLCKNLINFKRSGDLVLLNSPRLKIQRHRLSYLNLVVDNANRVRELSRCSVSDKAINSFLRGNSEIPNAKKQYNDQQTNTRRKSSTLIFLSLY